MERELRYRALFENSGEAVYVLGEVFEDCNPKGCELLGRPRQEIIGASPAVYAPRLQADGRPSDIAARQYIGAALAGTPQRLQWRFLRPNGEIREGDLTLSAAQHHGHAVVLATVRDITDQLRAEEALAMRLTAIEAAHDMIVISSVDGRIQYANPAFTECTGYTSQEAQGQKTSLLNSGKHPPAFYAELWSTILGGSVWSGEMINRRKDGSLYPEEMTITPVRDGHGQVTSFVAIKRDITRRRQVEEAQQQAHQEVESANGELRRQQDLLQNVIANIPHHVFWKDRDCVYMGCNRQFAKVAGLSDPADIVGKTDFDLPWTHAEAEHYRFCDRQTMTSGTPIIDHVESQRTADGSETTLRTSKVPLRDASGSIVGILGMYNDDTVRSRLERQVQSNLLFLQILLDTIPNPVFFRDLEGRYRQCNRALAELLGRDREAILGKTLADLLPSDFAELHQRKDAELLATGEVQIFESKAPSGDGFRDVCFYRARVCDQNGRPSGIIGVIMDLTDRRRAEAIERQTRDLQSSVEAMEQVLGVVGHELRTPLAAIRATSEFLVMDRPTDPELNNQFLQTILDESVRMAEMVNNLLEAARLNSGAATWQWSQFNVLGAAFDALSTVTPLIDPGVALDCAKVPADLTMSGDAAAIRRLILNLVSNAARHTRQGRIEVNARECHSPTGRQVILEVCDTGEGIPPELRDKLGVAFALNSGIVGVDHVRGAGLGLAICQGIVAAHGGEMTVISEVGSGTTFRITLSADLPEPAVGRAQGAITMGQAA